MAHIQDHTLDTLARIKSLRLIDDVFARGVFRDDKPLLEHVLCLITAKRSLRVIKEETQRDLKLMGGMRSVELDVWCVDDKGAQHNIEIQTGTTADVKRLRYYSAAMDVTTLKAKHPFSELPEQWIIMVLEGDHEGFGMATYRYDRTERATGLPLNDEAHIIIANCAYKGNDDLGRLLRSFVQSDPNRIEDAMVRKRVQYYKQQSEGVREMTSLMEQWRREDFESGRTEGMQQGLQQGMQQGLQQGLQQGMQQGLQDALVSHLRSLVSKLGMPAEEALEALDVPEADRPRYLAML